MRALGAVAAAALVLAAPAAAAPEWLAGDGHVHTCYSHDAYCGPGDDEGEDAFYSFGGTVDERFLEASLKGLDFLVISDHNDVRAQSDPAFGSHEVVGVPAYEASLGDGTVGGHAQMLGARRIYERGSGDSAATDALAGALRLDGGVFQANHPGYRLTGAPLRTCAEAASDRMDWRYGFSVLPDTIEVWNATTLIQPSELFWECWLQRGARIGALAGSDSHGANHVNVGLPTTWALAESAGDADILAAFRAGRTTLSRVAPAQGAARLLLEGDRDGDGTYESTIGDQVPPGTPLRVRADGSPGLGLVRVRANGTTAVDLTPLPPGGSISLKAPAEPGWVRATLYLQNGSGAVDPSCAPPESPPISTCTEDLAIAAMTSPIYVGAPAAAPAVDPGRGVPTGPGGPEPDRQPPLAPGEQPSGDGSLPDVPPQRGRAARVKRLRAVWFYGGARRRTPRLRLSWSAPEGPFEVQARRSGDGRWRTLSGRARKRVLVFELNRGTWRFRVRARPPFAKPSGWSYARARLRAR